MLYTSGMVHLSLIQQAEQSWGVENAPWYDKDWQEEEKLNCLAFRNFCFNKYFVTEAARSRPGIELLIWLHKHHKNRVVKVRYHGGIRGTDLLDVCSTPSLQNYIARRGDATHRPARAGLLDVEGKSSNPSSIGLSQRFYDMGLDKIAEYDSWKSLQRISELDSQITGQTLQTEVRFAQVLTCR